MRLGCEILSDRLLSSPDYLKAMNLAMLQVHTQSAPCACGPSAILTEMRVIAVRIQTTQKASRLLPHQHLRNRRLSGRRMPSRVSCRWPSGSRRVGTHCWETQSCARRCTRSSNARRLRKRRTGKFTSNLQMLVTSRPFLTDCLRLVTVALVLLWRPSGSSVRALEVTRTSLAAKGY